MAESKDTIYIDIDDEITSVIDKVTSSDKAITALVLPKRATVFQSLVNMKLLKKASEQAHKSVVLITSEAGLLPMAGAVGLHVAKTLQSKPEIPPPPGTSEFEEQSEEPQELEPEVEEVRPSEKSSKSSSSKKAKKEDSEEETIELENPEEEKGAEEEPKHKDKNAKVPNFNKFRKRLILGVLAFIILIICWIFAYKVLPKATITIKTDTADQAVSSEITVDTEATKLDVKGGVVPGEKKTLKNTDSQSATATGQKNVGEKASGTITIRNCAYGTGFTVLSGSKFTGSSGKVYVSQASINVPTFTGAAPDCTLSGDESGKATVAVKAFESGSGYNSSSQTYSFSLSASGTVDAIGSAMTGGTSKVITVVSQSDIDSASNKLDEDKDQAKKDLSKQMADDKYLAIPETFKAGKTNIVASPKVGEPGETVNVTSTTTYSMLGVKQDDLEKVIDSAIKTEIDTDKQSVQEYGFDSATFTINGVSGSKTTLSVETTVKVGPKLDAEDIKKRVAGKKKGVIKTEIGGEPGVNDVEVKNSPFWVLKTPSNTSKITVVIESANSDSGSQ